MPKTNHRRTYGVVTLKEDRSEMAQGLNLIDALVRAGYNTDEIAEIMDRMEYFGDVKRFHSAVQTPNLAGKI